MTDIKGVDELLKSGLIKRGNDERLIIKKLPTGIPALDEMLGGGMPLGHAVESYGPESTGKTLIAQYVTAAVQASQFPEVLYMDMERSFDEAWWKESGVDTAKVMVSQPATGDQAIDVMRGVLHSEPNLGLIIMDSIAAMTPQVEMDPEKSSEDKTIGLQARLVTLMYRQIINLLEDRVIFLATNQMRESIGAHDELAALPGGRAQRHYSHIILRTRRDSWITENKNDKARLGFYMEITSRKNKMCSTPDGTSITIPVMFKGQIDYTTSYIDDALKKGIIPRRGPYYNWNNQNFMGMQALRNMFLDNPEELELLKAQVTV